MSTYSFLFDEGHLLVDALDKMKRHRVGAWPVIAADGSLKGLLVRPDGERALRRGNGSLTVGEVCRRGLSVGPDDSLQTALGIIDAAGVGRVPVVDGGKPLGGISRGDIHLYRRKQRVQKRQQKLEPFRRSKVRWRQVEPDEGLTWDKEVSGDAFVAKAKSYGAFGADKAILEIGPGYGRLLRACLRRKLTFARYLAVDISPTNVKYLIKQFKRTDVDVMVGDIETVKLDERFDVVLSSLVLKHLYPTFEKALRNVKRHLNPGATVIFDLVEGTHHGFQEDTVTYIRAYSRAEVEEILSNVPLELVAFDEVEHDPEYPRLLVVARKASR
jgi:SAM-dependent methyltransferase